MITVTCDGCDKSIDRDDSAWFGVDLTVPPKPIDLDDGESVALLSEIKINGDHEFHFCSAQCLSAWAFGRELG